MKVREFIEYLKTQDQEAIVEVIRHTSGRGYYDQGGTAMTIEFDPIEHVEYSTFINHPATLLLGTYNA